MSNKPKVIENITVIGETTEPKDELRDYSIAYAVDDFMDVLKEFGVSDVSIEDSKSVGKEFRVLYKIELPFLEHPILFQHRTIDSHEFWLHGFFIKSGKNKLTRFQAEWILIFFKEMFVYRNIENMSDLKVKILEEQPGDDKRLHCFA